MDRGTQRAIVSGGGAFNGFTTQFYAEADLTLSGGAATLFAVPDVWGGVQGTCIRKRLPRRALPWPLKDGPDAPLGGSSA